MAEDSDLGDTKARLMRLDRWMPEPMGIIVAFGQHLAGRLNEMTSPSSFVFECERMLRDLERGYSSLTGEPIECTWARMPGGLYTLLWNMVPQIAESIFSKDFASEVISLMVAGSRTTTVH